MNAEADIVAAPNSPEVSRPLEVIERRPGETPEEFWTRACLWGQEADLECAEHSTREDLVACLWRIWRALGGEEHKTARGIVTREMLRIPGAVDRIREGVASTLRRRRAAGLD